MRHVVFAVLVTAVFSAEMALADTLVALRDGRSLEGRIVKRSKRAIVLATAKGKVRIKVSKVAWMADAPTVPAGQAAALGYKKAAIINGTNVAESSFPTVGKVSYAGASGAATGTLIASRYVLTAGHCAYDQMTMAPLANANGRFILGGVTYSTSRIFIHPSYNYATAVPGQEGSYDLAIFELATPVPGVTPSPIRRSQPAAGTAIVIVGYGKQVSPGTGGPGDLPATGTVNWATTTVETVTATCLKWIWNPGEGSKAPGDSGGPSFINVGGTLYLAGVTSGAGSGGVSPNYDGTPNIGTEEVDTRVDAVAAWIDGIAGGGGGGGGSAPAVAAAASASPNPVTATSCVLDVLGADDAGEAALAYTWSTVDAPSFAVAYSANGTNGSKRATVTFTGAGTYKFRATIRDAGGLSVTSDVTVVVNAAPTALRVSPASATVIQGCSQVFGATTTDQFGRSATCLPSWSVSGGGTLSASGVFAATAAGGPFTVTASMDGLAATASVTVLPNSPPTIASGPTVSPNDVTIGYPATFSAVGTDPDGQEVALVWDFGDGTTAVGGVATHTYAAPGNYTVTLTASDGVASATSTVSVSVRQANPLVVRKLKATRDLKRTGADSFSVGGQIYGIPDDLSPQGAAVTLEVGGAKATFSLDAKGSSRDGRFAMKKAKKAWTFNATVANGDFAGAWADERFVAETVKNVRATMQVVLTVNGSVFVGEKTVAYKAKAGKTGTAK